ncbi:hypothetical protein LZ30DRAFT_631372 [Colletotrichum cereale]|nr:hypothetical protein LZ30DRAFT_631372 [Colletotrichum cereale]
MVRKGSQKVRTGCVTCKARRVKCDETKPSCNRCIASGRICNGYKPVNSSELRHYQPYRVFPGANGPGEGRALQYFYQEAGPYLSGAVDPQFWPKLVMQFASLESAARHSVISISCLVEKLSHRTGKTEHVLLQDEIFALRHYNAAIRDLRSMTFQHCQPVVLVVCLLFIAIELLQANRSAAMEHCKHGFQLLKHAVTNYAWTREHLLPLFKRVSVVAFVHGDSPEAFSDLQGLEHPTPTSFATIDDAQTMLDDILSRTLRLVRNGDIYRVQPEKHMSVPPELLAEQACVGHSLDIWKSLFDDHQTRPSSSMDEPSQQVKRSTDILRFVLSCRYESCRIWLNTAFGSNGYDYSWHLEAYRIMFAKVGISGDQAKAFLAGNVYFTIDVGYLPSISILLTKCSHLESRLKSLGLMPVPGLPWESLCLSAQTGWRNAESARLLDYAGHDLGRLSLAK